LLRGLGRRPQAVAREVPRTELRRAGGDGHVHVRRSRGGHDRDRGVARRRHGGGRPLSTRSLYDEIQDVRARYPNRHSAILPAPHLAHHANGGWLPPEALEEVADALDVTPAYCLSIASFYDMFFL